MRLIRPRRQGRVGDSARGAHGSVDDLRLAFLVAAGAGSLSVDVKLERTARSGSKSVASRARGARLAKRDEGGFSLVSMTRCGREPLLETLANLIFVVTENVAVFASQSRLDASEP
jgi:hypothetical protein